jgi:uncharacterized protein
LKIGIISDTHDSIENIDKAVKIFKDSKISFVLHAGDYVKPAAVRCFQDLKLIGVLGNNDVDKAGLSDAFNEIGGELKGELYEFNEDGIKFAVYHGTSCQLKESLIHSRKYDVVICGHTHQLQKLNIARTMVINPGTAKGWLFGYKATLAIFETENKRLEFVNINSMKGSPLLII